MAAEPDDIWQEDEENEGGPVKPFLEHLEDLRWTLIKVFVSLAVAMLVCLMAGNHLVSFLVYPLKVASRFHAPSSGSAVTLEWGTNMLGRLDRSNVMRWLPGLATNVQALQVVPVEMSGRWVLALEPQLRPQAPEPEVLVLLKNYSPISAFMVAVKLALYGGLVLALPFMLYFIGEFVLPALKVHEKRFVLRALAIGGCLFLLGMAFCYFVMLEVALSATVQFSSWLGFRADEWRAEDYITFVSLFMLVMGLSFELPIVLLALVKVGVLDYQKLRAFRPYWVVTELVLCAFLTPSGDPFTMLLMAIPVHFLYEISTVIAWFWARREQRRLYGAGP
ncbi:MAG: twin-arginine translocase subunit TatC [Verrucomicrobiota bacterium]|nr:twin-arginine translocase subunit TatC [Limisphaera sp.]MDW8382533.1 twin-arginine translocase subunit TatC [Verrucomicrobiota bacterium]